MSADAVDKLVGAGRVAHVALLARDGPQGTQAGNASHFSLLTEVSVKDVKSRFLAGNGGGRRPHLFQ